MAFKDVRSADGQTVWDWLYNNKTYLDGILLDADGSLRLATPQWEDLRFPAQGINPPGAASDPTRNNSTGLLVFSKSAINTVAGVAQLPHSWSSGTALSPHIHVWYPTEPVTTTGDKIVWSLETKVVQINGAWDGSSYDAADNVTHTITASTYGKHLLLGFTDITMTGVSSVSACVLWRLSRLGDHADDNYNDTATLIEFDIHYQTDSLGSREETAK